MGASALVERMGVSRNSVFSSIQSERVGTISLNQIEKMAEAMGGRLVNPVVPREGPVDEIVMAQARRNAKRIIQRTCAHMAPEAQSEDLRSQEWVIAELAREFVREMPKDFWK